MVRQRTTFHLSITVDGHQVSERPISDEKREEASGLQGPDALHVLKELLAAKPREPVSLILHQSGDTLVGVASEGFLPVSNYEARNLNYVDRDEGHLPGCEARQVSRMNLWASAHGC